MTFLPAHPEQKKMLREFCIAEVERQRQYLVKRFKLRRYNPTVTFNFRTNGCHSWGGGVDKPFIMILAADMAPYVGTVGKHIFGEYEFLADKEGIGHGVANWKQCMAWVIAHELAHTLVEVKRLRMKVLPFFPDLANDDILVDEGHGTLWQAIYRELRVGFCTEDKYPVEFIDYSKAVFHTTKRTQQGVQYTFWRGHKEAGWYILDNGVYYKSNRLFTKRKRTKFKKSSEIRTFLVSV